MEESRTKEDVTKPRERQTAGNRPLKTQFVDERKRQQKRQKETVRDSPD